MARSGVHVLLSCVLISAFLLFPSLTALGQITNITSTTSKPTHGVGHDYIKMLGETVDPATGSITLKIDIPTPQGRGINLPFSFQYSSNGVHHVEPSTPGSAWWRSNNGFYAQGGWSYSLPSIRLDNWTEAHNNPATSSSYGCSFFSAYMFQDPSGSSHPLFLGAESGSGPTGTCQDGGNAGGGDGTVYGTLPPAHSDGTVTTWTNVKVFTGDGTLYSFPIAGSDNYYHATPDYIQDRNGNRIQFASAGQNCIPGYEVKGNCPLGPAVSVTDTIGRSILSASGLGPAGETNTVMVGGHRYQVSWKSEPSSFSVPSIRVGTIDPPQYNTCYEFPSASETQTVVSQIVLPNGQAYQFYYGSDNPNPAYRNSYGLLSEIDYPNGGWVRYKWGLSDTMSELAVWPGLINQSSPVRDGCKYQYRTPVIRSREIGFGPNSAPALTQTFTYSTAWNSGAISWSTKTTSVLTKDGISGVASGTNYTYSPITAPNNNLYAYVTIPGQIPVETLVEYKDGSSGATLKTVGKTWYGLNFLASERTTLETEQSSRTTYCYDNSSCRPSTRFPQLYERAEFDYGANSPSRRTVTTHQVFQNTPGTIADKVCQRAIYDSGGNLVAETDYLYDGGTSTCGPAGGGTTQSVSGLAPGSHDEEQFGASSTIQRGNVTSITRLCFQNCSNTTSTFTYDETGQVISATDGNGKTTQYSYGTYPTSYTVLSGGQNGPYTPASNPNASITRITYPPTGPVSHIESFSYDFNNSQLTASQDQNGRNTTYLYDDVFDRPTQINTPDGGQTTTCYVNGNCSDSEMKINVTKKVTSGVTMATTKVIDGLGNVVKTLLTSDPEGTSITHTDYDGTGRVWQQSNPYRSTGDPTYGITQTSYDALGRVSSVVKPDGSKTSISYLGNTTTITDEATNQRRSTSDALGRLVQVEEPGTTGTPASAGSGTAIISGTEQSAVIQTKPPKAATGAVQINGAVQWKPVSGATTGGTTDVALNGTEQQYPAGVISGSGTVTITGSEQPPKLMHAATPATGRVTINGTLQSKVVQTQWPAPGRATVTVGGYEQSYTDYVWTCADSGIGSFCWWQDVGVPDSGYVKLTVGQYQVQANYGDSSSHISVASQLTSLLNAPSSPVTATLTTSSNVSTISLTAKANGAASNYPLSTSCGSMLPSGCSFSAAPPTPIAALAGGLDPAYVTKWDHGSCEITINGQSVPGPQWGQGATAETVASGLAGQQKPPNSSYVNGSLSGNTVLLTATQPGKATNDYSLSSSCSYDSANFPGPSFSTSNSWAKLGSDNEYLWDSGTVSVTTNPNTAAAHTNSVPTDKDSTPTSIARALVTNINADAGAAITADGPPSGATVTLRAKTKGSISNYPFSVAVSYDAANFAHASFAASPSSPTLAGGWPDAQAVDHGTMTVTVNGHPHSVNWGQNDTPATIASHLFAAISSDPDVTPTLTDTAVYLDPKTPGTPYTFSTAYTFDDQNFTSSSFSTANSISDYGNATITVGDHPDSVPWAGHDDPSKIATALEAKINVDASAVVTAVASGGGLVLTAKATGESANAYTLSFTPSYDTAHFSAGQSFTSTDSGPKLAGGKEAVYDTVYDSGTVTLTVNSFDASVTYGQRSTAESVASALAAKLNDVTSSSPVTAVASGTTLTLTARQTGQSTNYSLWESSSSSQASVFSMPSFAIGLPQPLLAGGSDAVMDLSAPAVTQYRYDALDNLTCVLQKGQDTTSSPPDCRTAPASWRPRWFEYDSLSRLVFAHNPESGNIAYEYDANGNVTSKTDARGAKTLFAYDALNRLTQKSYQNSPASTATVKYGYDGVAGAVNCPPAFTPANPTGNRTSMCDAAGTETWSYSITPGVGWKTVDQRTTNGTTKTITTQNNLDGSLYQLTYPSGRTVTYTPGGAGRPLNAVDTGSAIDYVTNASYAPFGGLMRMNQDSWITVSNSYNARLQPLFLSASGAYGPILSLNYDFHFGSGDNGNIYKIVNGRDGSRTQNFEYDALNRISRAYSTGPHWGETFTLDNWGNLTHRGPVASKTYYEPLDTPALANNQLSGFGYDLAGNIDQNGGSHYEYDAESRLVSTGGVTYTYDGDGNRLMKSDGTLYWGPGPLAESDLAGNIQREFIYFGGKRVARRDTDSLHYFLSDHLGSTSVVTNVGGAIEEESDYYPYGGERVITHSLAKQNYKFQGKERDLDAGLDNFGARYYASSLGRFMTPDWAARPTVVPYAIFGDPQTLNLYAFVANNPINRVDADGHQGKLECQNGNGGRVPNGHYQHSANCTEHNDEKPQGAAQNQRDSQVRKKKTLEITRRIFAAATGVANLYFGSRKVKAAAALGTASTVDGPAASVTGTAAAYLSINGTGQVMTGAANLTYAITGSKKAEEAAQVLTAATTVSGAITLTVTRNVPLAASYGNAENMVGGFMETVQHGELGELLNSSVEWLANRISYAEEQQQQSNSNQREP